MHRAETGVVVPKLAFENGNVKRPQTANAPTRSNHVGIGVWKISPAGTQSFSHHVRVFQPLCSGTGIGAQ